MDAADGDLRERFERAGQGHVWAFFDAIGDTGRARLRKQLAAIDLEQVDELAALTQKPPQHAGGEFSPPQVFPLARDSADEAHARAARAAGAERLRRGQVAHLMVAGGQASRLGYDGPKGAYPVGPVTARTLFEVIARRLIAARERYGAPPFWYVLTSEANDAATKRFFAEHAYFGLERRDVFFFEQAMLPALDPDGRILMSAQDSVFLAPNGHGGVLSALARSGGLADARSKGVETFAYFQVDNPLARPADPLFLGLHTLERAEMSSKVVLKRDAAEKVGVLGRIGGRLSCIEYSDLPTHLREARASDGQLVYGAGNIAVHLIELALIDALTRGGDALTRGEGGDLQMPWHLARKKMAVIDADGRPVQVEGFKFETFVFDALHFTERSVTLEVDRKLEFSPLKNASGEDSPATVRADLCRLYSGWAERAGLDLPPKASDGTVPVEVDPVLAEEEDEFRARLPRAPQRLPRGHFYG